MAFPHGPPAPAREAAWTLRAAGGRIDSGQTVAARLIRPSDLSAIGGRSLRVVNQTLTPREISLRRQRCDSDYESGPIH